MIFFNMFGLCASVLLGYTPSHKWELSWPAQVAQVKNSAAGCVLVQAVSATSGWKQLFAVLFTFF